MDVHPENTLTEFKVRLPQPLTFQGAWDVALAEVTYPHRWYNVHEDTKYFYMLNHEEVTWQHKYIPMGFYGNPSELVKSMKDASYEDQISINYSKRSEKVNITIKDGAKMTMKSDLAEMLGYSISGGQSQLVGGGQRLLGPGEHPAEYVADVRPVQHLFVYTDIIEEQIVGDRKVPLLRTVKVTGKYGDVIMETFNTPHYIPLKQKFIDTITISLRDDIGGKVKFTRGRVILKLHFKRRPGTHLL